MNDQFLLLFKELYEEYYNKVFSYVNSKVCNKYLAEDLTEDIYYRIYKNIESFDPNRASPTTWVFVITRNVLKNYYRDKKEMQYIEDIEGFDVEESIDFEQAIYLEEVKKILDEQFEKLNETQKRIIVMRYFDELSFSEIARALALTEGNVRVILSRALKSLRNEMQSNEIRMEY